jgi:hypothetical protein
MPDTENGNFRKLAHAVIKQAQEVKHRRTPSRRDAGIAADSVIFLAQILRRLVDQQRRAPQATVHQLIQFPSVNRANTVC